GRGGGGLPPRPRRGGGRGGGGGGGPPANRRGRSGCSTRRSRSRRYGSCLMIRRFVSRGGGAGIGSCVPMDRSGLPTSGGSREAPALPMRSATITGSRTKRDGASGCSGRVSTVMTKNRPGLFMASFPEPAPRYAELQVTTNFSFLRGASHPDELVLTAAALGHQAIAITDRNSFAGIVRAHHAAKEIGIRLVVGCRLDLCDGTSLLAYPT